MMKIMINCLVKAEYFVAKNFSNINCYSCEINFHHFAIAKSNIGNLNNLKI